MNNLRTRESVCRNVSWELVPRCRRMWMWEAVRQSSFQCQMIELITAQGSGFTCIPSPCIFLHMNPFSKDRISSCRPLPDSFCFPLQGTVFPSVDCHTQHRLTSFTDAPQSQPVAIAFKTKAIYIRQQFYIRASLGSRKYFWMFLKFLEEGIWLSREVRASFFPVNIFTGTFSVAQSWRQSSALRPEALGCQKQASTCCLLQRTLKMVNWAQIQKLREQSSFAGLQILSYLITVSLIGWHFKSKTYPIES